MNRIIWILLFLFTGQLAFCQNYRISIGTGFGWYQLNDLKELQTELTTNSHQLDIKEVEEFPPYLNYSISFDYIRRISQFGLNAAFYTTGGRNHLKDYSGEYILDMPLKAYRFGIQYRISTIFYDKLRFYGQIKAGVILSYLDVKESIEIYNVDKISNSYKFNSISYFGEPSIGLVYNIYKNISAELGVGYQIDYEEKLYYQDYDNIAFLDSEGDNVYVNWSGARIMLGISYEFE